MQLAADDPEAGEGLQGADLTTPAPKLKQWGGAGWAGVGWGGSFSHALHQPVMNPWRNVHIGLKNACEIKTTGGPNKPLKKCQVRGLNYCPLCGFDCRQVFNKRHVRKHGFGKADNLGFKEPGTKDPRTRCWLGYSPFSLSFFFFLGGRFFLARVAGACLAP